MKYFQLNNRQLTVLVVLTILSFLILTAPVKAQITPNYGHPAPFESDMRFRDWSLDRMKKRKALTPEEQKLAYETLKKDFTALQVLNNDLIKARTSGATPDYNLISQKTTEIRKIALRLSINLKLPEQEEEETKQKQTQSNNADVNLSAVLAILDTVIYRFVKNPMFKNVEVIDVKDAMSAKEDLDRIMLLSERAKKKAENMSKNVAKQ